MSINYFECSNIGVSGTTKVAVKQIQEAPFTAFEARVGIALMGSCNMSDEDFEKCNNDPFHKEFYDNYASGIGATEEIAIQRMKEDIQSISQSLFEG